MNKKLCSKALSAVLALTLGLSLFVGGCTITRKDEAKDNKKPSVKTEEKAPAQTPAPAVGTDKKAGDATLGNQPLPPAASARNTPIVRAAAKVGPAVVGITNKALVRDFFNRVQLAERGTGSGVIYSKDGLIATNNHVVEGAKEIVVSLHDGKTYQGKVLGADAKTDLAVVKIEAKEDLPVAEFGDSNELMVGEPAIAIGNPLGLEFRGTVTAGVISALNRSIDLGERKFRLIQTDAAINPGNSGGALVNADGKVVGINSAKIAVSGVEGIGFAIPISEAKPVLDQLASKGKVARAYLGVSLLDKEVAARYGLDIDLRGGIYVMKLQKNSPAWNAGIRPNDIIVKFNGTKVEKVADLKDMIEKAGVGTKVTVTVLRGDKEEDLTVKLDEMPKGQ